jgi:hypothetical protein
VGSYGHSVRERRKKKKKKENAAVYQTLRRIQGRKTLAFSGVSGGCGSVNRKRNSRWKGDEKMPIGNPQYPDFWEVHQAEWESWMSFMEEELEREKEKEKENAA